MSYNLRAALCLAAATVVLFTSAPTLFASEAEIIADGRRIDSKELRASMLEDQRPSIRMRREGGKSRELESVSCRLIATVES